MKRLVTDLEVQYRLKKKKEEEEVITQNKKYTASIEDDTLVLSLAHEDAEVSNFIGDETLAFTKEVVYD